MDKQECTLASWQLSACQSARSSKTCPVQTEASSRQPSINTPGESSSSGKCSSIASAKGKALKNSSHSTARPGLGSPTPEALGTPCKKQRLSTEFPVASPTNSSTPPTPPDETELDRESGEKQHSKLRPEFEAGRDLATRILAGIFYADDPMGEYMRDKEGIIFSGPPPLPPETYDYK